MGQDPGQARRAALRTGPGTPEQLKVVVVVGPQRVSRRLHIVEVSQVTTYRLHRE